MPEYVISGSAVPTAVVADVSPLEDAVAGETGVTVESASRVDSGDLQFMLRVQADDEQGALEVGRRISDRLSPGSSVTVVD